MKLHALFHVLINLDQLQTVNAVLCRYFLEVILPCPHQKKLKKTCALFYRLNKLTEK